MRFVENVKVRALQQTQEGTSQIENSAEGIGIIRSAVIGIALFSVLSIPLLLNIQTIKYNSQITSMTYDMNIMNSKITDQKATMNLYLQEKFPSTTTFEENGQTFFVRSANPAIKGDAKLAARITGQ